MDSLADIYFLWLYDRIAGERPYVKLASYLHNRWEFRWHVQYDENRQADGYDQRGLFLYEHPERFTRKQINSLMNEPVSVFEVLVALVERMDFQLDDLISGPRRHLWFSELLANLELDVFDDEGFGDHPANHREIDDIIQVLLDRTYDSDGTGSLFPLSNPKQDMREVELWYQMMAYLHENYA